MGWFSRRYDTGAIEVDADQIREIFHEWPDLYWWPLDKTYLVLEEELGREFGWKYWSDFGLSYRQEGFDCDEYGIVTLADWCKGALKENFKNKDGKYRQPAMGAIGLNNAGVLTPHLQDFGIFHHKSTIIRLKFEPQTGKWSDLSQETVDRVRMLIR